MLFSLGSSSRVYDMLEGGAVRTRSYPARTFENLSAEAITWVQLYVLSYVSTPLPLFREWARVVRPGGHVVFTHRVWLAERDAATGALSGARAAVQQLEEEGVWRRRAEALRPYMPLNPEVAEREKTIVVLAFEVL